MGQTRSPYYGTAQPIMQYLATDSSPRNSLQGPSFPANDNSVNRQNNTINSTTYSATLIKPNNSSNKNNSVIFSELFDSELYNI